MKKVIIYPGRFQPMLPHHAEVFRKLQAEHTDAEVFIATANKVEPGKSPFDAQEKLSIMTQQHDIPQDRIIIAAGNNLYNKDSYIDAFSPAEEHSLFFAVGEKDMQSGDARFQFKPLKDGSKSYLQNGEDVINTNNAQPMVRHGYVIQAPNVPGISGDVASASAFRSALLSAPDLDSAKETYTRYMGEFNQEIFDLVYDKITGKIMKENLDILKKLAGLLDEAPVNFKPGKGGMDYEPGVSKKDQKAAAERPEKAAASNPSAVGFTKIAPEDMISVDTGKPINSRQRARSMANQFPDGADVNDPAVKKEMFLKLLAQSPGYVLGEINARLANDEEGFAVSDRLSAIVDNLPEGGIMALGDEDRKWTIELVNNAINNMELHRKDSELDKFDDLEAEPEPEVDMDEPEMVSLDDPEFDAPEDELEMEEMKQLAGLETKEMKNCGCGLRVCKTTGYVDKSIEEDYEKAYDFEPTSEAEAWYDSIVDHDDEDNMYNQWEKAFSQADTEDKVDVALHHVQGLLADGPLDDYNTLWQAWEQDEDIKGMLPKYQAMAKKSAGTPELPMGEAEAVEEAMPNLKVQSITNNKGEEVKFTVLNGMPFDVNGAPLSYGPYWDIMTADGHEDIEINSNMWPDYEETTKGIKGYNENESMQELRKLAGLGEGKMSDIHQAANELSKEEFAKEYPEFADDWEGMQNQDDSNEPSQDEIDANADAYEIYKKHRDSKKESVTESVDLATVIEEIIGEDDYDNKYDNEPTVGQMSFDDLCGYCGVTPEECEMDIKDYYDVEEITDEVKEKYKQDVLIPCANEVSMDHAEYESKDLDEFQQAEPDFGEPDDEYKLVDKNEKEIKMFQEVPGLMRPNQFVSVSPPTASQPAFAMIKDAKGTINKVSQDKLAEIGLRIIGSGPKGQQELNLPMPDTGPTQGELNLKGGYNTRRKEESVDQAIENALDETVEELKKLAGL